MKDNAGQLRVSSGDWEDLKYPAPNLGPDVKRRPPAIIVPIVVATLLDLLLFATTC